MKIIIPMAGMGKRMRPHTLTTPKPLIHLAGKPIVEHLIDEIALAIKEPIDEIAFVIGHFGETTEQALVASAQKIGAKGSIYYQENALGTAHAILCAEKSLHGPVVVAFADTLFFCNSKLNLDKDSIIWTKKVSDPSAFGVVLADPFNRITGFVEKPKTPVSNQAIIGIYFFKDGENLKNELQYLIDNDIKKGTEYQLTDALQNMMEKGLKFYSEPVDEWLDCGNKDATVETHTSVLKHIGHHVDPGAIVEEAIIIPPCFIAAETEIRQSVVGPYVSVEKGSKIRHAVVSQSIIQKKSEVENTVLTKSMIGNEAYISTNVSSVNLGDFSRFES